MTSKSPLEKLIIESRRVDQIEKLESRTIPHKIIDSLKYKRLKEKIQQCFDDLDKMKW